VAFGMALAFQGVCASFLYDWEKSEALLRQSLSVLRPLGPRREVALASALAFWGGAWEDLAEGDALLHEGMAIQQAIDDQWGFSLSLRMLGVRTSLAGDTAKAKRYLQESLAISRAIGSRWDMASALNELGEIAQHHDGDRKEARRLYQESLDISRELDDRYAQQLLLDYIGYIDRELGEYEEARRLHLESLAVAREVGDPLGIAGSLDNLGLVFRDLGDLDEAERHFEQALAIRTQVGHYWSMAVSYDHLADLALDRGDYERARQFCESSSEAHAGLAKWGLTTSHARMGELCMALGQTEKARERFWDALVDAMQAGHISAALDVLVGAARLAAQTGHSTQSAEWLTLVAQHPASSLQTRTRSQELLAALESQIGSQEVAQARARGQDHTIEHVAKQALALLRPE
jgi:tetratricopeptide (TPR) repeat protein